MFCIKCGNQLPDDALFCPKCGNRIEVQSDISKHEQQNKDSEDPKENLAQQAITNSSSEETSASRNSASLPSSEVPLTKNDLTEDKNQGSAPYENNPNSATEENIQHSVNKTNSNDISESWKRIFVQFDRINIYQKGWWKAYKERRYPSLYWSWWGFFFGPLYYLCKKMWLKLFLYDSLIVLITLPLEYFLYTDDYFLQDNPFRLIRNIFFFLLTNNLLFILFAKYDYYLFKRYNIKYVRGFPKIFRKGWFVFLFTVLTNTVCYVVVPFIIGFMGGLQASSSNSYNAEENNSSSNTSSWFSSFSLFGPNIDKNFALTPNHFNQFWDKNDSNVSIVIELDDKYKGNICHQDVCELFKTETAKDNCLEGTLNKKDKCKICLSSERYEGDTLTVYDLSRSKSDGIKFTIGGD